MFANGKGLFGGGMMASAPPMPTTKPVEGPTRRQRAFGVLGDMLSTLGGGQAMFIPQMMQQRQMEQAQGQRSLEAKTSREAAMQDWIAQRQFERANPAQQEPTAMQRNYEWLQQTNPSVAEDYLAAQSRDPNDEWVHFEFGDGRVYNGPRSGMGQAVAAQRPNRPAGMLRPIQPSGGVAEAATRQNTPRPQLGADGFPSVITRQQYEALVNESDGNRGAVDAFISRRGIQVRN